MKSIYIKDINNNDEIESSFIINEILNSNNTVITAIIGDKTGSTKAILKSDSNLYKVSDIITIKGIWNTHFKGKILKKESSFDIYEYLPTCETPIEDIMDTLDKISNKEFKSEEVISLNNYFFRDDKFLKEFTKSIGSVYQHHNYIGGLAEHTLGVMSLAQVLSHKYNCRHKEIAILSAKLHDIGKIKEMYYKGPFKYTLAGEMEGHVIIGLSMIEEAFKSNPILYSEDFKTRVKACVTQHHGKPEFGSPKDMKTVESYIVHYADYVDATLNKINIITKGVNTGCWTEYEKRIEGKLYL